MTKANVNTRINRLRTQHADTKTQTEPPNSKPKEPISATTDSSFPFKIDEQVLYEGRLHTVNSVGKDRIIIRENASLTSKTITADDYKQNKGLFKSLKEKPQNAYERVSRNRPDEEPEPEPTGLKTKFEQVAEKLKEETSAEKLIETIPTSESPAKTLSGRKPATINQDFEDAVCEMEAEHEAKKKSESIPPMEPIHIDLEMDDWTDPVDYIDPEWGAAEKEISDTVLSRRGFLDEIDRLLDLMIPICVRNKWSSVAIKDMATSMLRDGITDEIVNRPGEETGA